MAVPGGGDWLKAFGLAVALVSAAPAAADEPTRALRDALRLVPAARPEKDQVYFFDLNQAAAVTGKRGIESIWMLRRGGVPSLEEAFTVERETPGTWLRATGFGLDQLASATVFGSPPRRVHVYRLALSVPAAPALAQAWRGRGFAEEKLDGRMIWRRGQPGAIGGSIENGDPFNGVLGGASQLLLLDSVLVEASYPETLREVLAARDGGSLGARRDVAAILNLLDARFASSRLLNAMLHANTAPFASREGIPPYSVLLIADLESADAADAIIALAFANCAAAGAAKAQLAQDWKAVEARFNVAAVEWSAAETGSPCPLLGRIRSAGSAASRGYDNPPYSGLYHAFVAQGLPLAYRASQ